MNHTDNSLNVIVDCIVYRHRNPGGILHIFSEILPRMCGLDDSLHVKLLITDELRQRLPTHSHISRQVLPRVDRYLRPRRLWEPIVPWAKQFVEKLCIGRGGRQIWHSTYFTLPHQWNGASVVTVYDMIYERFPKLVQHPSYKHILERKRRCIMAADAVICISGTSCQDLLEFYNLEPSSVHVVHLAYSQVFRQLNKEDIPHEHWVSKPFLLYVGKRHPNKNFDGFINAYAVWPKRKEITLVIVGEQWTPDERHRLSQKGIAQDVILLDGIDDEGLCRLYNQATALVFPSLYEGFGIPLLEAMACGCPVVASRILSTVEITGDCPIFFDPTKIDDMLAAFDVVLSEGKDLERLRAGLEQVKNYSWNKTAKQTLDVYRSVAGHF